MDSTEQKKYFEELLDDYSILIREQNTIKYEFISLFNIILDMEYIKHKKVVKDDNETYCRTYEFQRNYRQSLYLDIPDDENKYYYTKKLDELCIFTAGSKIDDNYINVFDKFKINSSKKNRNNSNSSNDDDSELSKSAPDRMNTLQTVTEYPIYGDKFSKKIDNYNRERFNIIIDRNRPNLNLTNYKLYLDENYISISMRDENNLLHQYIGFFLYKHIDDIYIHSKGTNLRTLDLNELKNIKINIPLSENHIMKTVKDCEIFYNDICSLEKEIIENKKRINLWNNFDINIIGSDEIIRLKIEIKKIIEDNKLNRKDLKKLKTVIYNEMFQEPLNEPSFTIFN